MLDYEIRPIDLRSASDAEYVCLNAFENILRYEVIPEDPAVPLKEDVERWQATPPLVEEAAWCAWQGAPERIIALAGARIVHTGDNKDLIDFNIEVLP